DSATWDEDSSTWRVRTSDGDELIADAVISSQGMFGPLRYPDIGGRDTFTGATMHTAKWNDDHDLTGERVAVIGSAASAVQLLPELAKRAGQVHLYQRSANWVLPKEDTPFTDEQLERFRNDRGAVEAERAAIEERMGAGFAFVNADARALCEAA